MIGRSEYTFKAIPVIEHDSFIYTQAVKWSKILHEALAPADYKQIFMHLTNLRAHFKSPAFSEIESQIVIQDFISDLAHLPLDLIELTCRQYRRDSESKYFPKPGQLRTIANAHLCIRVAKLNKLNAILQASADANNKPTY
ncbi:MAG: hypothetical protein AABY27_02010 [Pseudomonadota bacterium]